MQDVATNNQLVYVVDDDASIARLVAVNLAARGYRVKQFYSGQEALAGLEVAKTIRQISALPILILSVRDEPITKLAALDLGADDYLTKPFRVDELLARVRAILRRSTTTNAPTPAANQPYQSGDLEIDLEGRLVASGNEPVQLTPREWGALRVLINRAGRIVSSRQLLQEAWEADYGDEGDYVRAYITRLRRKLEPEPHHPRYILLERGLGYRLAEAD